MMASSFGVPRLSQVLGRRESRIAPEPPSRPAVDESTVSTQEAPMSRGKMKGDNSAESKRGQARGSGGTMKNQNPGKQDNNKAQNTKSNKQ
jgi:hypothetical protein